MELDETVDRDTLARSEAQPQLREHLFLVLDGHTPKAGGARYALDEVDEIVFGRGPSRTVTRESEGTTKRIVVRVPDPLMSGSHARVQRTRSGWRVEDLGSRNGTLVDGQRQERTDLDAESILELGSTFFAVRAHDTPPDTAPFAESHTLAGRARGFGTLLPNYARELQALAQIAFTSLPVLLLGESGTGKEVLASGIHALSGRRGELVAVNCGALPPSLVEGQLFGHVKGAYSGALRDEIGFVRASDKGTLFLDEIGDLAATSQAALLRVLQEGEVTPVGSTKPSKVDLRVISATLRQVERAGASQVLRTDLYARLSGYTHHLRPLRERKEDLGMLVGELLERIAPGPRSALGTVVGTSAPCLRLAPQRPGAPVRPVGRRGVRERGDARPSARSRRPSRGSASVLEPSSPRGYPPERRGREAASPGRGSSRRGARQRERGGADHGQDTDADPSMDAALRSRSGASPAIDPAPGCIRRLYRCIRLAGLAAQTPRRGIRPPGKRGSANGPRFFVAPARARHPLQRGGRRGMGGTPRAEGVTTKALTATRRGDPTVLPFYEAIR